MYKTFREWFTQDYLMQSPIASQLINGHKHIMDRQERICQICEMLIEREGESIDVLRSEIAFKYFVTSRCAFDYIKHAQLFVDAYYKKYPDKP